MEHRNKGYTIKFTENKAPTDKVLLAWAIHFNMLHELGFETAPNHHPSWNGNFAKNVQAIADIRKTMTDEEKKELDERCYGSPRNKTPRKSNL